MYPLVALIEATESLLAHEDEERYALSPTLRRLRVTLAFAKQRRHQSEQRDQQQQTPPVYVLAYHQHRLSITSIIAFDAAAMAVLIWEMRRLSNAGEVISLTDDTDGLSPFHHYSVLRKEVVELVLPDEQDEAGLLAVLCFDPSLRSRETALNCEQINVEETTAAALLHRGLAEHVETVLEDRWKTCVQLVPTLTDTWATCIDLLSNT